VGHRVVVVRAVVDRAGAPEEPELAQPTVVVVVEAPHVELAGRRLVDGRGRAGGRVGDRDLRRAGAEAGGGAGKQVDEGLEPLDDGAAHRGALVGGHVEEVPPVEGVWYSHIASLSFKQTK
jgi:hypothetical protein